MAMPAGNLMNELLKKQNEDKDTSNMTEEQMKGAVGGLLSFVKSKMSPQDFEKIKSSLPEADELVKQAETKKGAKKGEGESISQVMGQLQESGVDPKTAVGFTSLFTKFMNTSADVDVSEAVAVPEVPDMKELEKDAKGIMGKVGGMFGKK